MTAAIVICLLAVAALFYIAVPIGRSEKTLGEAEPENEAEERKRVALGGIIDLEEERDAGKLSDPEFVQLRSRYERDAVLALKELDDDSLTPDLEARLEREIAGARDKLRCRTCGAPKVGGATRCPSCGSSY